MQDKICKWWWLILIAAITLICRAGFSFADEALPPTDPVAVEQAEAGKPPAESSSDHQEGQPADNQRLLSQLQKDLDSVESAITGTRKLIEQSMHRPYLPDLYLRLAELYISKSRILYHLKRVEDPEASLSVVALEANLLKTKAIDLYIKLLKEFPDYAYHDKVLFFMAHEYRELGQFEKMLKCYIDIVEQYPKSSYSLESYLLIGDYYFDSMNLEKAEESYQTILKKPESYVHGMARYKMSWCHINRNNYAEALTLLEKLVLDSRYDEQKTSIDAYKKINLRREALMDLAYCYTEVKKPEGALEYFAEMSDSKTVFVAALNKLGHRYFLQEKWAAGAMVYRKILSLSRDVEKNTEYAEKLFVCAQKAKNMERPEENVKMMVKTLEELESSWRIPEEEKAALWKQFELYARDLATRMHVHAKEKEDKTLYSRASDAYSYYLDFFERGRAVKDLRHNQAEAFYLAGRYFEAAQTYEDLALKDIAKKMPNKSASNESTSSLSDSPETVTTNIATAENRGEQDRVDDNKAEEVASPESKNIASAEAEAEEAETRQEDLYNAVASYYKGLKEEEGLNDLQKMEAREGLSYTGKQYLAMFPQADEAAEVGFNVAWVSYEQGDYGMALERFRVFIKQFPRSKEALAAGHLILDINKNLDNLDGLIVDARDILANDNIVDSDFRKEVESILMAAEHRHLEELTVKVKDGAEGSDEALIALGESAKDVKLQEMALYNIFVVNKEAEKIPEILKMGGEILNKFSNTGHREDILSTMAHFYLKAADFPNAAEYSEKASNLVKGAKQTEYLIRAARLQGWMGNTVSSVKNYRKALPFLVPEKQFETKKALLHELEILKDWPRAASLCRELMNEKPKEPEWVYRYGRALQKQKRKNQAMEAFKKTCTLFNSKAAASSSSIKQEERAFAAQARFSLAEQDMKNYQRISIRSNNIDNTLIQRKIKGLQTVETACLEVAQYASPRWTIAALERAAQANDMLCSFFLDAPVPNGLNMAQKQQYRQLLEEKVAPFREKARQYRSAVLKKAYNLGIYCPEVRACYVSLNSDPLPPAVSRGALHRGGGEGVPIQSIAALQEALYADPENPALLRSLAGMYAEEGKKDLAVLILHRCLEKNPLDARAQNLLGVIRFIQGRDQESSQCFFKALDLGQGLDEARANLVVLNEGYGNFQEAKEILSQVQDSQALISLKAWAVHPSYPEAVSRLEVKAWPSMAQEAPLAEDHNSETERQ